MSTALITSMILFACALVFAQVLVGWREAIARSTGPPTLDGHEPPFISAIIPARNEEANIAAVLQDLFAQRYPRDRMHVIVVDDGSTDGTVALVEAMIPRWPQLQVLASAAPGKKAAISTGVHAAKGALVILTDADVRFGPERIAGIVAHWQAGRSDMMVLPVFTQGHGVLGRLQEEEQAALLGMVMGSSTRGRAALAYGANLAFTRDAFFSVGGYEGDRFASGDDLFLLQRMQRAGKRITSLFDREVLVTAVAAPSFSTFVQQRLRWAGKMRGGSLTSAATGLAALSFPWFLLWASLNQECVGGIGSHALYSTLFLAAAWICWTLPVIALVRTVRANCGRSSNAGATLLGLVAFSCYAPIIALASLVVRPKWKGRHL